MSAGHGGEGDLLPPEAAIADYLTSLLGVATAPEPTVTWRVFETGGLRIALPVAECGERVMLDHDPSPAFGPERLVVDVRVGGRPMRLIHLLRLLVPAARCARGRKGETPLGRLALSLRVGPWALLLGGECPGFAPRPESVVWRSAQTSRPWLAGVDRDNGIALLDVPEILQLLENKQS